MTDLDVALNNLNDAQRLALKAARGELGATLAGIFENEKVFSVAWGQKTSRQGKATRRRAVLLD